MGYATSRSRDIRIVSRLKDECGVEASKTFDSVAATSIIVFEHPAGINQALAFYGRIGIL